MKRLAPIAFWFFLYVLPPSPLPQFSPPFESKQRCQHGMAVLVANDVHHQIEITKLCFDDGKSK